jgi:hypothetical protein
MASTKSGTIILRSNNPDNMMQRTHRAPCQSAVTVTPGQLLVYGTTNTVKPHATADGGHEGRKIAIENPWSDHGLLPSTAGPNIDHAYAAGETVEYVHAVAGDEFYMLIAAGQNIAKGAPLVSNGDGSLKGTTLAATTLEGAVIGYAAEAVDNSGGGTAARIRVYMA